MTLIQDESWQHESAFNAWLLSCDREGHFGDLHVSDREGTLKLLFTRRSGRGFNQISLSLGYRKPSSPAWGTYRDADGYFLASLGFTRRQDDVDVIAYHEYFEYLDAEEVMWSTSTLDLMKRFLAMRINQPHLGRVRGVLRRHLDNTQASELLKGYPRANKVAELAYDHHIFISEMLEYATGVPFTDQEVWWFDRLRVCKRLDSAYGTASLMF